MIRLFHAKKPFWAIWASQQIHHDPPVWVFDTQDLRDRSRVHRGDKVVKATAKSTRRLTKIAGLALSPGMKNVNERW